MPVRPQLARMLDGDERNIGGALDVVPNPIFDRVGAPVRVINAEGNSRFGTVATIALEAEGRLGVGVDASTPQTGPVVVTIEYGSGAVSQSVELDLPNGRVITPDGPPMGIIVSVPASAVRVIARNDGSIVPHDRFGAIVGNIALGNAAIPGNPAPPNPVMVRAHLAYGTRSAVTSPRRFQHLARHSVGVIVANQYNIPKLARRVRFIRDLGVALSITFTPSYPAGAEVFTLPAGVQSPVFEVPAQASILTIDTGGIAVLSLVADWELQL